MSLTVTHTPRAATSSAPSRPQSPDTGDKATAAIVIPVTLVLVPSRRGDLAAALPWAFV